MTKRKKNPNMEDKLNYSVFWSEEDGEYVATTELFPSLSWFANDPVEALAGLYVLVIEILKDIEKETNHEVPE